jgi:O-antigen/teichoic acid export membrane protein
MFSFAGWSLVGNFGFSARDQGLNIILNLFFDVTMNAAKGIATSVSSVIQGFIANFQMAVNPQITKLYASGREMEMVNLVMYSAKYSFYLVLFVAVPFFFQCEYVLNLWIGNVSVEMLTFMRLTLIMMLIDSMVSPVVAALCATGNIKKFQILISIVMLLNLPMAYVWLKLQANPYIVSYTAIFTSAIGLFVRLKLLSEQTCFSLKEFMLKVIFRILPVAVIVSFFAYALYNTPTSLVVVVVYCLCTLFFSTIVVFLLGLGKPEREVVLNQIKLKIKGDSAN